MLALLFRVLCNERPSDITLYHLGCFKLAAPDHSSTHLASLALAGLQQDAVHHIDDMLEAFRGAGAVLLISAPKCKQSERKRGRGGGQQQHVDWLSVRKHLLQPQLALWDPARLVVLCLMASWFSRGSIAARLLLSRRFRSAKAAPKRQQQPDFQDDNTRTRPLLLTCRPAQSGGRARRCPLNFQQAPALLACPWTWSC